MVHASGTGAEASTGSHTEETEVKSSFVQLGLGAVFIFIQVKSSFL